AAAHREVGVAAQAGDSFFHLIHARRAGAGDAGHRDVVDKARTVLEHHRQARIVGGRGGQADEVDAGGLGRVAQVGVVLRRQVNDDQAVHASLFGIGDEARYAIVVDRVEIT